MKSLRSQRRNHAGAWAAPVVLSVTYVIALALLVVSALESDIATSGRVKALLADGAVALALSAFFLLAIRFLRQRDVAFDAVKSSNDQLEQRVSARTAELSSLARHLLSVREDEKKSTARELHDEFGSFLTAINMDVSRLRDKVSGTQPELAAKFDRTLGLLNQTIDMKRRLISDLRPSILDNLGLGAALEQYIDEWTRDTGISARFAYSGDFDGPDDGCPIAIFRVFQEALDNIARHSRATRVESHLRRVDGSIELEIADNGVGMSHAVHNKPDAHGLLGMRERVLAYRGQLEFSRRPAGGTVVRAWLPRPRSGHNQARAVETTVL